MGLKDVVWHVKSLNERTIKALNDSQTSISLLNAELTDAQSSSTKSNGLRYLTATQGDTSPIIKMECCVYIPDYHKNVTGLLKKYEYSSWHFT